MTSASPASARASSGPSARGAPISRSSRPSPLKSPVSREKRSPRKSPAPAPNTVASAPWVARSVSQEIGGPLVRAGVALADGVPAAVGDVSTDAPPPQEAAIDAQAGGTARAVGR